jgi:hypothetical protein
MQTTHCSSSTPTRRRQRLELLKAEIVELSSQLTAASARLTRLIGEFEAAEGWGEWGMRSTAHWLSWHCGMALGAAREQVRVARALPSLPVIAADYAAGRLSYSKVRALTRFATPQSDAYLASIGRHSTGAQIEKLARAARRARTGQEARDQAAAAYLRIHVEDDGTVVGSFRLAPADGAVFMQAIEAGAGRLPDYRSEGDATENAKRPQRVSERGRAAVLAAMSGQFLDALINEATPSQAERFQLVIHSTAEQLARPDDAVDMGDADDAAVLPNDARLHSSTLRRLTCDCPSFSITEAEEGTALHVGRRSRRIGGRLRRAVEVRDRGRCRAPGCSNKATEIHHVRHWANGGSTCLRNLISLCDGHHWVVHEGGFTIVPRSAGRWALLGPTGVVVEPEPPAVEAKEPMRDDPSVSADASTGRWDGSRMDSYAIDVILTHIGAFEPPMDVSAETPLLVAA